MMLTVMLASLRDGLHDPQLGTLAPHQRPSTPSPKNASKGRSRAAPVGGPRRRDTQFLQNAQRAFYGKYLADSWWIPSPPVGSAAEMARLVRRFRLSDDHRPE